MRDYSKITAWRLADDFTVAVYEATRGFPRDEVYGLTSQLRRASYSTPANIAEGAARASKKDYLHFLYIARGSCCESQYFVHLAYRLGYLDDSRHEALRKQVDEVGRTLGGLIRAVEKEVGLLGATAARVSALLLLAATGWLGRLGLWSTVYSLRSTVQP